MSIEGATGILINVTGGANLTLFEVREACNLVGEAAHEDANIIFGSVVDSSLKDDLCVTVIATGFDRTQAEKHDPQPKHVVPAKTVMSVASAAPSPVAEQITLPYGFESQVTKEIRRKAKDGSVAEAIHVESVALSTPIEAGIADGTEVELVADSDFLTGAASEGIAVDAEAVEEVIDVAVPVVAAEVAPPASAPGLVTASVVAAASFAMAAPVDVAVAPAPRVPPMVAHRMAVSPRRTGEHRVAMPIEFEAPSVPAPIVQAVRDLPTDRHPSQFAMGSGPVQSASPPVTSFTRKSTLPPGVPRVHPALAQVLADVEMEDELDIPAFLRRHPAPTNG